MKIPKENSVGPVLCASDVLEVKLPAELLTSFSQLFCFSLLFGKSCYLLLLESSLQITVPQVELKKKK